MKILKSPKDAFFVLAASISLGLVSAGKDDRQEGGHTFSNVRSNIEQYIRDVHIPSISIAVSQDGNILWEESFGMANVEKQIRATPHTLYHLGSLGKVYTATTIMILRERGLIDLDKPANDYLGKAKIEAYEGNINHVTLRRILNHTSGLPFMWTHLYGDELDQRPSWDEVIGRFGKIVSPPGDRYIYSNLGFGILGNINKRLTGKSYHEFMKSEVFQPLGFERTLVDTGFFDGEYIAQKYTSKGRIPYFDMICKGGGTVYASAHDLVGFGMFHLRNHLVNQKPILNDTSINEMQTSVKSISPQSSYRIGWSISNRFGYAIVQHGGHVIGAKAELMLVPSQNIAVAVLSNGEDANTTKVCDWVLSELLKPYKILSDFRNLFAGSGKPSPQTFSPSSSLVATWKGQIRVDDKNVPVQIIIEDDGHARMKYIEDDNPENPGVAPREGTVPQFANGIFTASFPLEIPTQFFIARYPHMVHVEAKLRGTTLSGYVLACALEELPHFNIPFNIRLEKMKE
jgi:CubicO group peptidase (beta-lactamase class C family)